MKRSFTLIELLVVIAIFGLTASLITASYLTFERNQRLKNAALMIKSDVRLVADKAFSGDKIINDAGTDTLCLKQDKLIGWYLSFSTRTIDDSNTKYRMSGRCRDSAVSEVDFGDKIINLPSDVIISDLVYTGGGPDVETYDILFSPLLHNVYVNDGDFTPDFVENEDSEGNLNLVDTFYTNGDLVIELTLQSSKYKVTINSLGEVREEKI
ncbi:hypothetical protein A2165_04260 [Candidatus Curtissbacteria bacterium RBG_13_40_7]|uniref:Type II secretion system protein GspH n=1 Tax=Candidatus Curtissbacteria bacterium RBG_13_40_7 TaxID=1797706 RepID=A0A1F5FUH4_9BACT|nr:MAG: hypothetical protein A2165_04260 [Candidatus Curtissbacteria bacterium RBG_13_40_7]